MKLAELNKTELAAIYRIICPKHTRFYGNPPELWTRDVLLHKIRVRINEVNPHIPVRGTIHV
jgi:hypothetical protein